MPRLEPEIFSGPYYWWVWTCRILTIIVFTIPSPIGNSHNSAPRNSSYGGICNKASGHKCLVYYRVLRTEEIKNEEVIGFSWQKKTSQSWTNQHFWDVRVYNIAAREIYLDLIKQADPRIKNLTWNDFVDLINGCVIQLILEGIYYNKQLNLIAKLCKKSSSFYLILSWETRLYRIIILKFVSNIFYY